MNEDIVVNINHGTVGVVAHTVTGVTIVNGRVYKPVQIDIHYVSGRVITVTADNDDEVQGFQEDADENPRISHIEIHDQAKEN